MIGISVLGPVAVERDGRRVPVPGGKTSELLVRLALEAGTFVGADRLVEDVWAEDAVTTRRNTLQSKIAKLRRAFGDPRVIESAAGGYRLAVDASAADALAVLCEGAAAADLLDAGDDRAAAELSASALDRYRGDLLHGAGDWAVPYRARLDEARMELTETRFAARLRVGGAGEEIGDLESAVETYPYADAAGASVQGVRSRRQANHLGFARAERANLDAALAWSETHNPLLALRIVNGFGWAWIVLGDSRGAQRLLRALDAAGNAAPIRDRAGALVLAAWIEASTGRLELAREHIAAAEELAVAVDDIDLRARCCYYLACVVSHHGDFGQALHLTDRSSAVYHGLDRPWDQAANWLFAARAAISAGDHLRAVLARDQVEHWLRMLDDPWLGGRRDAILGELARIEHRFDDAVIHLRRAAEASGRFGFLQREAYQLSCLGRAQCQAGDYVSGAARLELAIEKAEATGDVRLAALARVHLGRVLRATGQTRPARAALDAATAWHRAAGGGEQAALGDCLPAALDASDQVAGAEQRLVAILAQARREDDAPVEVLALDALARVTAGRDDLVTARDLCEAGDRRMGAASHIITDLDRSDARAVRQIAWASHRHAGALAGDHLHPLLVHPA